MYDQRVSGYDISGPRRVFGHRQGKRVSETCVACLHAGPKTHVCRHMNKHALGNACLATACLDTRRVFTRVSGNTRRDIPGGNAGLVHTCVSRDKAGLANIDQSRTARRGDWLQRTNQRAISAIDFLIRTFNISICCVFYHCVNMS